MKHVKLCRSLQLPLVLTIIFVLPLFTASACAQDPRTSRPSDAAGVSSSGLASKWIGAYDGVSRACSGHVLTMYESTFNWVDCKDVKIRVIAASDTELVFEVDPNAKCGVSGWIVALTTPSVESHVVSVNTYRNLKDYQSKEYRLFCTYYKRDD
jgi:hypothetical protein